ncbi:MAG: ferrous iron transporter B [Planctomycetaceae bacterium]
MSDPPAAKPDRIQIQAALVGNPNTGKSTLFTVLAGIPTRVGNYPGVTVERKQGRFTHAGVEVTLVDLPGTYSLDPKSPDERVTIDVLFGRTSGIPRPDCLIAVVDATNLERNLFLVSQLIETGLPVIVALTLSDEAQRRGLSIDAAMLADRLGCPVVAVASPTREGIDLLKEVVTRGHLLSRPKPIELAQRIAAVPERHSAATRDATARYAWVEEILAGVVTRHAGVDRTPWIDSIVTSRFAGTLVFVATMLALFASIFALAPPLMDLIASGVDAVAAGVKHWMPDGTLRSLVVDGVIAGVGGVVVFLPQIAMLFFFVAVLEDCGYLARAAFLMDRLLAGVGLGGRSFIPLLSSFACAIPGIMATRGIESRRERLLTILVAPLMSCSARLPVYVLLCGAFVPDLAVGVSWLRLPAVVLTAMYAVGVLVAAGVAFTLSRTLFIGPPQPFVLELPPWRWPQPLVVLERVREACWSFLHNAGTLILAMSVVIWALGTFPRPSGPVDPTADEATIRGEGLRQSALGRAGRLMEPVVRPLGWDWRIGCAVIASFPAREVVLGTLGVIYNLGTIDPGEEEGATMLVRRLKAATWDGSDRKVYTLPVALSIMVFFALCAQCASTLVVISQETGSWIWPVFAFAYMTALAWLGAFVTFQVATAFNC